MAKYHDPVCGMSTDEDGKYLHHRHAGENYYFCNPKCLEKFKAEPDYHGILGRWKPKLRTNYSQHHRLGNINYNFE